jgi:hypothetical protein
VVVMSIRQSIGKTLILWWMIAGLQVFSSGQNPPAENPPAQNPGSDTDSGRTAPAAALSAVAGMQPEGGTADTGSTLPQIPGLLGGVGISPAFLSEMEKSNYLRGGVNVGAAYDDNPLLLSSRPVGNASVSIFPNIKIDETSSRMRWMLGYAGGLTVNQRFTNQNQGSHDVNFDSEFRLSPHVNLRVAENFSLTTGFFDAGNGSETVAGSSGPNTSLITPLASERSSVTTVETNYHFALNDLIGASGSFNDTNFSNPSSGAQLQLANSQTASGSAFWLHRVFGADWGGVSYRFDRITFSPGGGESHIHSFFAVDTLSISKRFTLTGFIGPQYSDNQGLAPVTGLPVQFDEWSIAGGAEGGWKNEHTSVSAGFSRLISGGGGVLGAERLQTVHGNFRRQLTPGWAAALAANYGTNQALTVPFATSASSINLTSVGVSVDRNVGKSVGLRMGYSHYFQEQFGVPGVTQTSPLQTLDASRNLFFFTLSYQWVRPLGM